MIQKVASILDQIVGGTITNFLSWIKEVGDITMFGVTSIRLSFTRPNRYTEIIKHMEFIGNQSVFIVALTALFTGLALSFQLYLGFKAFNAVNMVGPTVALGITRELGPVLTGLIVAARAGGAMAARLGTMRVNEQIDALDVMGVNTRQYLIAPRIYAAVICMPLLTAVFDFVAMLGSYILCVKLVELDEAVFWDRVNQMIEIRLRHLNEGLFKAAIFGLFFAVICTYRGFNTSGGAKGVGEATNRGVVSSMVMIIILDYFLTNVFIRTFYQLTGIQQ
jgi:phospholipid/cholesterol/gamma-HCH transport system permease protein